MIFNSQVFELFVSSTCEDIIDCAWKEEVKEGEVVIKELLLLWLCEACGFVKTSYC